jgi:HemY protein
MWRLALFLVAIAAIVAGLHWLSNEPGKIAIDWNGYAIETTAFRGVVVMGLLVAFATMAWNILKQVWRSPAAVGNVINRRREQRGLEALSSGLIALGTGDANGATRAAVAARKSLPHEPLTHLLRAQAAQLQGDSSTARRIFQAMLSAPDTEQLGLRGLFLEAEKAGEPEAAMGYAARALGINPKLDWAAASLFDLQVKASLWDEALETLGIAKKHGHMSKADAERKRAVILTAQAQALEDDNAEKALALSMEAHGLAPDLVPAAVIAGRLQASRGQTPKAAKVLQRTWKSAPHPELAYTYAFARVGDSPKDRLERVRTLVKSDPGGIEGAIAVATQAMEARAWDDGKRALEALIPDRASQRVYLLLARIEGEGLGNAGRARELLARAVGAPRDPQWTADGVVAAQWSPVSPKTRQLDAFEWKVPVASLDMEEAQRVTERVEKLVALGTMREVQIAAPVVETVIEKHEAPQVRPASQRVEPQPTPKPKPVETRAPITVTATPVEPSRSAVDAYIQPAPKSKPPGELKPTTAGSQSKSVRREQDVFVTETARLPDDPGPDRRESGARPEGEVERLRKSARL